MHSMAARSTFDDLTFAFDPSVLKKIDTVEGKVNLHTTLGGRYAKKPIENDIPISISAMSYGALSKSTKISMGKASAMVGTSTNSGEGGMLVTHNKDLALKAQLIRNHVEAVVSAMQQKKILNISYDSQ